MSASLVISKLDTHILYYLLLRLRKLNTGLSTSYLIYEIIPLQTFLRLRRFTQMLPRVKCNKTSLARTSLKTKRQLTTYTFRMGGKKCRFMTTRRPALSNFQKLLTPYFFFLLTSKWNQKSFTKTWVLTRYLPILLQYYTGFYTKFYFINMRNLAKQERIKLYWKRYFVKKKYFFKHLSAKQFFNLFLQLSYFKNPRLFVLAVQKKFYRSTFKQHRRLFFLVKSALNLWYLLLKNLRGVKGYSLFFKGKLGKKGSVRKRKIYTKKGLVSLTNKSLRVNTRCYTIWTVTGSVGAGISIFF